MEWIRMVLKFEGMYFTSMRSPHMQKTMRMTFEVIVYFYKKGSIESLFYMKVSSCFCLVLSKFDVYEEFINTYFSSVSDSQFLDSASPIRFENLGRLSKVNSLFILSGSSQAYPIKHKLRVQFCVLGMLHR